MYRENPEQADDRQYYDYHLDRNGSTLEAENAALRQPPVSGRVCFSSDCFYHDKTTDTCVGDYAKCTVKQTHR